MLLKVSVIVICFNEERNIRECLDSLVSQDYPKENYEIIVADNNSTDGTGRVVTEYAVKDNRVKLFVNYKRSISCNRNFGLKHAEYDHIAFIDADCVAPSSWLSRLATGFELHRAKDRALAGVGGSNVSIAQGPGRFVQALTVITKSFWWHHGSIQGKVIDRETFVPHIPTLNVLYDKRMVEAVGGFDVAMHNIGEDEDLSYRLSAKGYKLLYLPQAHIWHKLRYTVTSWAKKMFSYGMGRAWLLRKHPRAFSFLYLAPIGLVLTMPLVLLSLVSFIFLVPLIYFAVIFFVSLVEGFRASRLSLLPEIMLAFVTTHLLYGLGEIYGFCGGRGRPN